MSDAGPLVLDVFNSLLRHLRRSVNCESVARHSVVQFCVGEDGDTDSHLHVTDAMAVEQQFQNAVVGAIGMTLCGCWELAFSSIITCTHRYNKKIREFNSAKAPASCQRPP